MGVALWILCGVATFVAARAIAPGRPNRFAAELVIALVVAFAAGLAASAMDFGGWGELDWRAALFAMTCSLAAIGANRVLSLMTRGSARS